MEEILSRVKLAMKKHHVTHQILSDKVGINKSSIDKQLSGHYKLDLVTILALLELCPVSANWLLRGTGDIETPQQEQFATINDKLDKILSIVSDK